MDAFRGGEVVESLLFLWGVYAEVCDSDRHRLEQYDKRDTTYLENLARFTLFNKGVEEPREEVERVLKTRKGEERTKTAESSSIRITYLVHWIDYKADLVATSWMERYNPRARRS